MAGDAVGFGGCFRSQAVVHGCDEERAAACARPCLGVMQQGEAVGAAGNGEADARIIAGERIERAGDDA